mmetsp:Transcript_44272/g.86893  ORF Transcript_44272/g.86893 Transcript_44272/m.86893 type:complete len:175 (+) Transcript_44272:42-566(+)
MRIFSALSVSLAHAALVSRASAFTLSMMGGDLTKSGISEAPKKWMGGAGIGKIQLDGNIGTSTRCQYDMVLVERIQGKPATASGLFVPDEDLPALHLAKVLSVGPGMQQESGIITRMPDIKSGDYVIVKNPWGIGPRDEETGDGRKLSFVRGQDIAAGGFQVVREDGDIGHDDR